MPRKCKENILAEKHRQADGHVAGPAEDYCLLAAFAVNQADTRPVFSIGPKLLEWWPVVLEARALNTQHTVGLGVLTFFI